MANLYIGDTHFGHSSVINFDQRPFADQDEMEQVMFHLWNSRVQKDDDVWIIGDFCYRSDKDPVTYLRKLKGKKHLLIGNHDGAIMKSPVALSYFESVERICTIHDGENRIIACHFPLAEWEGMYHGSWHVYAHIHKSQEATYEFMKTRERALNAGCMINNYSPVSFRELVANNQAYKETVERSRVVNEQARGL